MNAMKRLLAMILILVLACTGLAAAEEDMEIQESIEAVPQEEEGSSSSDDEVVTEKDGWHFNAKGFLVGDNPSDEYIREDEKNGEWQYASGNLSIKVTRGTEKPLKNKRLLEYCVAEIWCTPESPMGAIMTEPYARFGKNLVSGKRQDDPQKLLDKQPSVLAVSDDMYGLRIMEVSKKKTKYDYHGVVIRDGEVKATKTRKSPEAGQKDKRPWPNLDTLAVYRDGSMKSFVCDAKTAEEYLEEGAVQVFAFGPWLLSEGKINPDLQKASYYPASEPRVAIGMIEPYHYIIIATSGRPKTKYIGAKLLWLAEKMQELGCTEALNLDGGATVVMAFNNKIILQGDHGAKRNIGSLIAFGLKEEAAGE